VNPPITDPPMSRTVLFRVALDVLIGGLLGGITVYSTTNQVKPAIMAGCAVALKTLQSRMAPSPHEMNVQRQAEKEGGDA
jgi:hypothetical protein